LGLYKSKYRCKAALPQTINSLPKFRDKNIDFNVKADSNILESYKKNLGKNCGRRIFPYNLQDHYTRDCNEVDLECIILENEILKATFLPTLGGRLISLYDKELKKELLYASRNIQSCNLAARDAWFSGGIEFNIGQFGHSLFTMDNVFAASVTDENGEDFLRIGEYEKMHGLYYHIDFHLPSGSHFLYLKGEISNFDDKTKPFYAWINTALVQKDNTRIFSSNKNALFINPFIDNDSINLSKISLPKFKELKDFDASYPASFPFSCEYFNTCNEDDIPYQVTVGKDGYGFVDFSTSSLSSRKMFCWGSQNGGKRWQLYLNGIDDVDYVEVQAGMASTQLNGDFIYSGETKSFVQAIGSIISDPQISQNSDYEVADKHIKDVLIKKIGTIDIYEIDKKLYSDCNLGYKEILNKGSFFATLNSKYFDLELPRAYDFLATEGTSTTSIFESIYNKTYKYDISHFDNYIFPPLNYYDALNHIESPYTNYLKSLILIEEFNEEEALKILIQIIKTGTNHCLIYRAIAQIYFRQGNYLESDKYYLDALEICNKFNEFIDISNEYSNLLITSNSFEKEKQLLQNLDILLKKKFITKKDCSIIEISDSIALDAAVIAAKYGDLDKLEYCLNNRELSCIREGNNPFVYLYNEYKSLKVAKKNGVDINDELRNKVSVEYKLPLNFDFSMTIDKDI
jgi:hypothetical protein